MQVCNQRNVWYHSFPIRVYLQTSSFYYFLIEKVYYHFIIWKLDSYFFYYIFVISHEAAYFVLPARFIVCLSDASGMKC